MLTLTKRYRFEICQVCFWEDEYDDGYRIGPIVFPNGPDDPSPANEGLTLNEARANYQQYGACEARLIPFVRRPTVTELPQLVDPTTGQPQDVGN